MKSLVVVWSSGALHHSQFGHHPPQSNHRRLARTESSIILFYEILSTQHTTRYKTQLYVKNRRIVSGTGFLCSSAHLPGGVAQPYVITTYHNVLFNEDGITRSHQILEVHFCHQTDGKHHDIVVLGTKHGHLMWMQLESEKLDYSFVKVNSHFLPSAKCAVNLDEYGEVREVREITISGYARGGCELGISTTTVNGISKCKGVQMAESRPHGTDGAISVEGMSGGSWFGMVGSCYKAIALQSLHHSGAEPSDPTGKAYSTPIPTVLKDVQQRQQ